MPVVTVIYDTRSGHTRMMAEAVAEGARAVTGVKVKIMQVEEATGQDILETEGLIVGSPAHCGLLSWRLKKLFDDNIDTAWGKVKGHIGAAFASSGGLGGGNEMTLWSILNILLNYGFLVFGLPEYAAPGVTAHYGAAAVGKPGANEIESCRLLGLRMAEFVLWMHPSGADVKPLTQQKSPRA